MSSLLHDYVTDRARVDGDAMALVMGAECLTYGELEQASNRLARMLVEVGCRRGDRVCLLAPKAPATIVAMLATLKAGCAYVPIDVTAPAARTARIVQSVEPGAILALGSGADVLAQLPTLSLLAPPPPIGVLDEQTLGSAPIGVAFGPRDVRAQRGIALARTGEPQDPAHILFTSGSTGEPKGVVITHASVRAFLAWAIPYFSIRADDRLSCHPPLHFDLSTFDIYGAFCAGATVHLVPPDTLLPAQLAEFIAAGELTQWFCVPSTMSYMARFGGVPRQGFPSLRRVLWCGEVLPTPVLSHWMERIPQASFTNLYGPTETTIASSYYTIPRIPRDERESLPIGRACDGEELLIIADGRESVGDGDIGELCIGGVGMSPGYWRDVESTLSSHIPDPRPERAGERVYRTGDLARRRGDGEFTFLGRKDSQIKSRGYRIELGEIEAAIGAVPGVAETAIVAIPSAGFEGNSICCAFAPVTGSEVNPTSLRTALSSTLPAYMLPTRWKAMDALPKNVNGKIDRKLLGELFAAEAHPVRR